MQSSNLPARRLRRSVVAWSALAVLLLLGLTPLLFWSLPLPGRDCLGWPWCPPSALGLPAGARQADPPAAAPKPALTPAPGAAAVPALAPAAAQARPGCALYPAAGLPHAIPDNDPTGVVLTVPVPLPAQPLTGVGVVIDELRHPYVGDLRLTLAAPDGASFILVDQVGNDTDDFLATHFHDDAPSAIADAVGPFSGAYRPDQALAPLGGLASSGAWSLHVSDLAGGDTGTLHAWSLELCAGEPLPPPPVTETISPAGGALDLSYGLDAFVLVPGAGETITITLATTGTRALPEGAVALGGFFVLTATDAEGTALTTLDEPAQVTIHYGHAPHRGEVALQLFAWDSQAGAYAPLPTARNPQADTLTATLPTLTEFGVAAHGYESFLPNVRR